MVRRKQLKTTPDLFGSLVLNHRLYYKQNPSLLPSTSGLTLIPRTRLEALGTRWSKRSHTNLLWDLTKHTLAAPLPSDSLVPFERLFFGWLIEGSQRALPSRSRNAKTYKSMSPLWLSASLFNMSIGTQGIASFETRWTLNLAQHAVPIVGRSGIPQPH